MIKSDRKKLLYFGLGGVTSIAITALVVYVLIDILEKKQEAKTPFFNVVTVDDTIEDPAVWGKNFPHHYHSYLKTVDQQRTRYGGSEALPRTPTLADPRSIVAQSRLEEDPRLKTMWAGYAFSKDFREERGHAYMLLDQKFTERQHVTTQPGTCLNCHASTYVAMKKLGDGDLFKGFEKLNSVPYTEAVLNVKHPVSCIDCHTPGTMQLRITRPAFIEGIRALKEGTEGIKKYDVNSMASPREMRTFVCAQCHVEYYFKGDLKRLTFPWSNGLKADQILAYYDKEKHKDWKHSLTGASVLKAQHPEFEMYSQGIHARSGVSCVDCHMPYERIGAFKITDHHVRSPVLNVSRACRTCHNTSEDELKARIFTIQDRTHEMRNVAMDALTELIQQIEAARKAGMTDEKLVEALGQHRRSQFFLDFVEAENSQGFHAPGESLRLLGLSIDASRKGQNSIGSSAKKPAKTAR